MEVKVGGGASMVLMLSRCVLIPRYVCDDAPTPWEGDVIGP